MPPRRIRRIPARLATPRWVHMPRGADVRCCHGCCWAEDTSDQFADDHLVPGDHGSCKAPTRLPPDCDTPWYGIKGRSGRRPRSTGESAWLTHTRIGP